MGCLHDEANMKQT